MQLLEVVPDFEDWPERWMGVEEDLEYGRRLLEVIRPFAESLVVSGLSKRTVKDHLDFLWLFGGELIREVSVLEEYEIPPIEKLRQSVDSHGGPSCRHLDSRREAAMYHRTCSKLARYIGAE